MIVFGYVVVGRTGKVKSVFYQSLGAAKRGCRYDGDSVVCCEVDLDREPIFIRARKVDAS